MWRFLAGFIVGAGAAFACRVWIDAGAGQEPLSPDQSRAEAHVPSGAADSAVAGSNIGASTTLTAETSDRPADPQTTQSTNAAASTVHDAASGIQSGVGPLDITTAKSADGAPGDKQSFDDLTSSGRLWCQFGPGNGGMWPNGKLFPHTAQWQGGPITFDNIDFAGKKARLTNDSGMTATEDGELDVSAIASAAGAHFSVIAPDGELIVVTVHAALDAERRFPAVVALHGPGLSRESAQFYGSCSR